MGSGGYYNWLGWKEPEEMLEYSHREQLEHVCNRLTRLSYAQDAAIESLIVLAMIEEFESKLTKRLKQIQPVWQALEYFDSHDRSEAELLKAIEHWRVFTRTEPYVGEGI